MNIIRHTFKFVRRAFWLLIVAYMLAIHNVYNQDQKLFNDSAIVIEQDEEMGDEGEL